MAIEEHSPMLTKREFLRSAALASIAATAAKSGPALATAAAAPNARDIAEAGFIYGLPIVMNYGVMYQFAVDRNSGQFKAPFNEIANAHAVFTYKDTAVVTPNADTPYSVVSMDLRAEPLILSVPGGGSEPVLFGPTLRRKYIQLWLYRQPHDRK
jgi:hypothetical protein